MSSMNSISIDEIRNVANSRRGTRPLSPRNLYSKVNFQRIIAKLGNSNPTSNRFRLNNGVPFKTIIQEIRTEFENLSLTEKQKYETVSAETGYKRRERRIPERNRTNLTFTRRRQTQN